MHFIVKVVRITCTLVILRYSNIIPLVLMEKMLGSFVLVSVLLRTLILHSAYFIFIIFHLYYSSLKVIQTIIIIIII